MTPDEFPDFLRRNMGSATQVQYAKQLGISPQHLSDMLAGRRDPGEKVLIALGLTRHVQYLPTPAKSTRQRFTQAQLDSLRGVGDVVLKASLPAEEGGEIVNRDDLNALLDFALQAVFGMLVACPIVGAVCLLVYALGLRNHWWL